MVWQARPQPQPSPAPTRHRPAHVFPTSRELECAGESRRRRPAPLRRRGATAYAETGRAGPTFCRPPTSRAKLGRPDPLLRIYKLSPINMNMFEQKMKPQKNPGPDTFF